MISEKSRKKRYVLIVGSEKWKTNCELWWNNGKERMLALISTLKKVNAMVTEIVNKEKL